MKKVSPNFAVLLMISIVFGWLILSFAIAANQVQHGQALSEQQRWIDPFVHRYAGYSLYAAAICGLLLAGWWSRVITSTMSTRHVRKSVNATIRDMLRLSRTDDELLNKLSEKGIAFNARTCVIPGKYLARASNRWLSRLLLTLMRIHAKAIVDHLERVESFGDQSDTVFHSIASALGNMHPDDMKRICRYVRKGHEFFGIALEKAVAYMTLQREIEHKMAEQKTHAFDYAAETAAISALADEPIGALSIRRRQPRNVISWAKAYVGRFPWNKTAPVRTAA
jgi:hypothetical protein